MDPREIPNGYCEDKHRGLDGTISKDPLSSLTSSLRVMSCHEFNTEDRVPCVGWLHNQLTVGNNIGLRIQVSAGHIDADYELSAEQHECFEDTLPEDEDEDEGEY